MPPKITSSRTSSSSPTKQSYAKRTSSQSKSARQQFSACGACRMRRVKCDLKDRASSSLDRLPTCTNCRERGMKCVDEYAEVKAVKLLRRGRRLAAAEEKYGRDRYQLGSASDVHSSVTSHSSQRPRTVIPMLKPDFFDSVFFRRFCVQRPVLDPAEFRHRFCASLNGAATMTPEAELCALVLVVWAFSFGLDESGMELQRNAFDNMEHKHKTDSMVDEVLSLIDLHGVLRRPTWDGVRALLLFLPLTEDVQSPMDRVVMHETALSQVNVLCAPSSGVPLPCDLGPYGDALVRARIYWYAYALEGLTTGLRGGRLVLDEDGLSDFMRSIPRTGTSSPLFDDASYAGNDVQSSETAYFLTGNILSRLLHLSSVCRRVNAVLTGSKASRLDHIDEDAMLDIWTGLSRSWDELDSLRRTGINGIGSGNIESGGLSAEDVERFTSSWQIFIFECHNIIREALKSRIISNGPISNTSHSSPAGRLHAHAINKCRSLLPHVMRLIHRQRADPAAGFFAFDASVVRDGCFFAGYLLAQRDIGARAEDPQSTADMTGNVQACLEVLSQTRWVYSKSDERAQTIRIVWDARQALQSEQRHSEALSSNSPGHIVDGSSVQGDSLSSYGSPPFLQFEQGVQPASYNDTPFTYPALRSSMSPLTVTIPPLYEAIHSAPPTASSADGSWPTYTPPSTGHSAPAQLVSPSHTGPPSPALKSRASSDFGSENVFPDVNTFHFSSSPGAYSTNIVAPSAVAPHPSYNPSPRAAPSLGHPGDLDFHSAQSVPSSADETAQQFSTRNPAYYQSSYAC